MGISLDRILFNATVHTEVHHFVVFDDIKEIHLAPEMTGA
jgi:hypothetical protein